MRTWICSAAFILEHSLCNGCDTTEVLVGRILAGKPHHTVELKKNAPAKILRPRLLAYFNAIELRSSLNNIESL